MSRHNATARREATAAPLVLATESGRTVEGYRPADEDLAGAAPGTLVASGRGGRHAWKAVTGPHLRVVCSRDRRSQTGVVGISFSYLRSRRRHYVVVNLGSTCRRFCVETLGRAEALRRARQLRAAHVRKVTLANAVILQARDERGAK